jgi:hypothetical protein
MRGSCTIASLGKGFKRWLRKGTIIFSNGTRPRSRLTRVPQMHVQLERMKNLPGATLDSCKGALDQGAREGLCSSSQLVTWSTRERSTVLALDAAAEAPLLRLSSVDCPPTVDQHVVHGEQLAAYSTAS